MEATHSPHPQEKPKLPTSAEGKTAANSISDAIEQLLQNPELIATVASSIGIKPPALTTPSADTPTPPLQESSPAQATAEGTDLHETVAALAPLLSGFAKKGAPASPRDEQRACLLRALKPYVNRNRADAIDTILQLSKISGLFRHLT